MIVERLGLGFCHPLATQAKASESKLLGCDWLHSGKECHLCLDTRMPGINISRAEAAERSSHLAIKHYDVTLDVTTGEETFIATSKVSFSCNKPGYDTFIEIS